MNEAKAARLRGDLAHLRGLVDDIPRRPSEELRTAAGLLRGEPAPEPHPVRLPPRMPDVYAEPLADLLDDVAGLIDSHPDLARPHVDGEPCGDLACRIVHHALAVARAILGRSS